jgi:hypothetical protein
MAELARELAGNDAARMMDEVERHHSRRRQSIAARN